MSQFRATIDSNSPAQAARKLEDAGLTLIGPWAAESPSAPSLLGLTEELEVTALVEAADSEDAEKLVREILGVRTEMRIVEVAPTANGT